MDKKHFNIQKETFIVIFLILTVALMFMPFVISFNEVLTQIVIKLDAFGIIERYIVPAEVRLVGAFLLPFKFQPVVVGEYLTINTRDKPFFIEIAWNCIGWQSLLFFIITTLVGLQGDRYTVWSKLKALLFGFLGTFLVNLLRITSVALTAYYLGQNIALVLHDYGSTITVVAWLFFYWWFAYSFILEDKAELAIEST